MDFFFWYWGLNSGFPMLEDLEGLLWLMVSFSGWFSSVAFGPVVMQHHGGSRLRQTQKVPLDLSTHDNLGR
jgi:hypothetical protein